jgi:hypothetical protein
MSERSQLTAAERPLGIGADRRPRVIAWSPSPTCTNGTPMGSGGEAPENQ